MVAIQITSADVTAYRVQRLEAKAAPATVNRELAALKRMFSASGDLRLHHGLAAQEWRQVDFKAGVVTLDPGTTKNRDGRTFPMTPELRAAVLEVQRKATEAIQRKTGSIIPWVFHWTKRGRPLKGFTKAWRQACIDAGVPGRIPHDLRRTAVRNLERAGVPRSTAMAMVGHRTEAIYRRYAIVDELKAEKPRGSWRRSEAQRGLSRRAYRGSTTRNDPIAIRDRAQRARCCRKRRTQSSSRSRSRRTRDR